MRKRMIILMAAAALIGVKANAQSAVTSAGGEAGTVSFTVGQPFVTPAVSDAGSLTPGVQQAYEITIVNGIENTQISLEAEVYPNPVVDRLTLSVSDADDAVLHYTLTDANGRSLSTAEIVDAQTSINMSTLAQGVYFLRVDDGQTLLRTFKIVKR